MGVSSGSWLSNKQEGNPAWMRLVCATADQVILEPTDASRDAEGEDEVSETSTLACASSSLCFSA